MAHVVFVGNGAVANGTDFSSLSRSFQIGGGNSFNDQFVIAGGSSNPPGNTVRINLVPLSSTSSMAVRFTMEGVGLPFLTVSGLAAILPIGTGNYLTQAANAAVNAFIAQVLLGNDTLDISGTVSAVWGDVQTVAAGGVRTFGNDYFYVHDVALIPGGTFVTIYGDALAAPAGTQFVAGNDIILADSVAADRSLLIHGDFGVADGSGLFGSDTVIGGAGADVIYGDSQIDSLVNGGNDHLDGREGNDLLHGGGGNDTLLGGLGLDGLNGNEGNDQLHGGQDADALDGGNGFDYASYESHESPWGQASLRHLQRPAPTRAKQPATVTPASRE